LYESFNDLDVFEPATIDQIVCAVI